MNLEVGVGRPVELCCTPTYHRAWGCRAEPGASPQHRGHPHSWVGGSSSCGSSGIVHPHSSGHTRTRGSSVTSLRALCGREKGYVRVRLRERGPLMSQRPGGRVLRGGADAREGRARSSPARLTWARTQAAEAALLVSREDVGAPVPAGPRGTVRPQALLLAHPAAAGAGLPGAPGGPGAVPGHAARARAQGQLCATGRS